ncbi:MAG: ASPIC/UnbV domain-containing protein [Acidobacteriota bacterium]|nr:ASPIC/UnbV domain-containing protein [Acidobacteriota bacterium]
MENRLETDHAFLSLKLVGVRSNRDAIGAMVELLADGRRRVRQVTAGDGYLSQSSSTIHFGLGEATSIDGLTIQWPGGARETIEPMAVNGRYRVVEGEGRGTSIERPTPRLSVRERQDRPQPMTRILLKTPLPLPPPLLRELRVKTGTATLVNLWAHWCLPCAEEVRSFAAASTELNAASIHWSPVSLDPPEDRDAATDWYRRQHEVAGRSAMAAAVFLDPDALVTLETLIQHVTGRADELPIPANLLIDAEGRLQILYFGAIIPSRFLSDAGGALDPAQSPSRRSLYPGRWYYGSPRNLGELGRLLKKRGRQDDAEFYLERSDRP